MKKSDKGKEIFDAFDNKLKELEEKIESPETERAIKEWLKFQSKFHNYSFRNTIWMMMQAKARDFNIERVAPFKKWAEMKGAEDQKVSITKGSKGFTVLFPYERISYERDENGKFIEDENGKRIPELDENGKVKKITQFGIGYVFDISQTNAKEIGAVHELNHRGEAVEMDADLLKKVANRITERYKIQVDFVKDPTCSAGGWYNPCDNKIGINLSTCKHNSHRFGTLMHELGHSCTLDDCQDSRKLAEGKAEAFAYAACSVFGIERDSQLYIKNWVENEHSLKEVMGDISQKVREAFKELQLNELVQEHSQELNQNQEQEHAAEMVA